MKKLDIKQAEPIRAKFTPDWEIRKGKYLYKKVAFDDYNQALEFLQMIKDPQIELDHFADIGIFYNELILMVYTHDVGGLTQLDFELALHINEHLGHLDARTLDEGNAIKNPKNTFLTKADTAYDFIKVGTNLANLKDVPAGGNMDEPDIMIAPYAGAKEMKYLMKQLNRIGYKTQDAQGYQDAHYDDEPTGGEAPPQMKAQGPLGKIKISKLKGVQKERTYQKLAKQLGRVLEGDYAPLQIDRKGRVINGHHRLDALRLVGEEYARVHMIDDVVENIAETYADDRREKTKRQLDKHDKAMIKVARDSIKKYEKDKEQKDENFADGKKKGKSRPGRVKKSGASCNGSVTALRKRAKNASGEKAKMYHWCANMKGGKKK